MTTLIPLRLVILGLLALACTRESGPPAVHARGYSREVTQGLARVRAVTAAFQTVDSAVAAGYARTVTQCIGHQQHGAMGYHHVNRQYVDGLVEVDRPEILLYERRPDGSYALTAVEYIVPYTRVPRDATPPRVFGLELKPSDELRLWYLHMWAWKPNSNGLFADWHPEVRCPNG